jgi:hypothetical protein
MVQCSKAKPVKAATHKPDVAPRLNSLDGKSYIYVFDHLAVISLASRIVRIYGST